MRRTYRILMMKRARAEAEQVLSAEIRAQYRKAWAQAARHIRSLSKAQTPDWWGDWANQFRSGLSAALTVAAEVLVRAEQRWFIANGRSVKLDPEQVVAQHAVKSDLLTLPERLQARVEQKITDWSQAVEDAAGSVDDLLQSVQRTLSDRWADLTAAVEVGLLAAATTLAGLFAGGLDQWTWESMRDNKVCEFCMSMDGLTFNRDDPMPPEAAHDGCRCQSSPVLPELA